MMMNTNGPGFDMTADNCLMNNLTQSRGVAEEEKSRPEADQPTEERQTSHDSIGRS